ncbi:MAG: TonB-dependent receptor [Prevotellaceae bacterium]|nr:TonB-dependent receptor [Prevotellaceae bacterium]
MKKKICMIFVAIVCTLSALAQGTVKGKVIDKQSNEALQFVNVVVADAKTGKMVKGAMTDVSGAFSFNGLAYGNYAIKVTYVGYKEVKKNVALTKEKPHANYPVIYLSEDHTVLKEVQVTGQRSQMKLEVDRKTFSADQIIAAAGGSASDLLENIPSVEVTTDGEISLRGNSSVEVWINGKASGLTSDNRGEILQQIPAESIERIEVIDNPSSKFSPEGSAGIINIILKRDRKAGYYGSVRAGVGNKGAWNTGGNINYSSGLMDAYANLGFRQRKGGGGSLSEQTYLGTNTYQNYVGESDNSGRNLFARAGLTWHVTKKDDISLSGMTMQGKRDDKSFTPYRYGKVGDANDSYIMYRNTAGGGDMSMYHGELGYVHSFSDKHKLDLNISFDRWMNDGENRYQDSTVYYSPVAPTAYSYQYRPMFIRNRSWEVKLDYENQITDKLKLEAGYNGKLSHENTPQESWIDDNSWEGTNMVEDTKFYNRFIYDIDVHALYATLTTNIGKLGIMAGLRGEYWKVDTESYTYEQEHDAALRDAPFKKDYFQLFPSLFLNYHLTETSQLQLNYTRRLRRPRGGELNSFKDTRDASMVSFGNPQLTPEYTNAFALNFLKTWQDHTLSLGTYYRPTTDVIQRVKYMQDNVVYSTNENVAKSQSAGMEVVLKDKLFRILDLTTTVNAYYYKLDGFSYTINDQLVTGASDENFSWDARLLASLILPYDISLQATGNYTSRRVITQGHRDPSASLDLGLRKSFFNKALALAVNWRDVFQTRKWKTYTASDSFERYQENWRDPRFNVTLTWSFGNMTSKKKKGENRNDEMNQGNEEGGFDFE